MAATDDDREIVKANGSEPPRIGRGTAIGIGLATVLELMFARAFALPAAAAPLQRGGAGSNVRQLPAAEAYAFVKQQLAENSTAQRFKLAFEKQKYQFILERAKAYVVGDQTLAILPSLVPVKRTDPSHQAIGLSISSAGVVAAGALISHSPRFEVTEFMIYELDASGELKSKTISTRTLSAGAPDQILKELGDGPSNTKVSAQKFKPARKEDLDKVVDLFYREVIADRWSSPLYPPEGVRSMLAQIPVIQKFSEVNGLYYRRAGGGGGHSFGFSLCTSTSSNICTSCSVIIEL